MNIRLIGGKYGGRILDTPPGRTTHPMGERIRNALFNSIQADVSAASVLDVFAGTGSLGLEALSRGAKDVTFIEKNRVAASAIRNNIALLGLDPSEATLAQSPAASWIDAHTDRQFDIIFVDPPYHETKQHLSTITKLFGLLKPGALMVLSKPGTCEVPIASDEIVVVDNRSYSNATLIYYRRKA